MNNPLNEVYYKCMLLKAIYKVSHFLIGIYKWREDCEFSGITLATVCAHTVLIKCICFHFQELLRYMWNHTHMLYTSSDLWITQTIPSQLLCRIRGGAARLRCKNTTVGDAEERFDSTIWMINSVKNFSLFSSSLFLPPFLFIYWTDTEYNTVFHRLLYHFHIWK